MTTAKKSVTSRLAKRSEVAASSQWGKGRYRRAHAPGKPNWGQKNQEKAKKLAMVADPFGASETAIISPVPALLICVNNLRW